MKTYKIAIVGLGSIGTRHINNVVAVLREKNIAFTIDLIRSSKGKPIDEEIQKIINCTYYNYDDVLSDYDIMFVTNPTINHYDTIKQFTSKTKHMFIEKPLFHSINVSIDSLGLKKESIYYVACPLRYTNVIQYLKHEVNLEKVHSVRAICSSYLPEWRPNQDYRKNYSARIDMGGGVSIDLIHEWDYLRYLFGQPMQVMNIKGKFSELEIDSDDLSIYIAKYPNMAMELHLDYFGRKNIRELQLFMEDDTIIADIANSEIRFMKSGYKIPFHEERNEFQINEMRHFFDIIDGTKENDNNIWNALDTLKITMGEI